MASGYTCFSCCVAFSDADIHKSHYRTDWHRYNLKRKVVQLPPVTAEEFQSRILYLKEKDEQESQDDSAFCKICRKSFSTSKAFNNHLNSKKHKLAVAENNIDDPTSEEIRGSVYPANKKEQNPKPKNIHLLGNKNLSDNDEDSDWEDMDDDSEFDEDVDDDFDAISEDNPILMNNCLFCSHHSGTMSKNLKHMTLDHSFFIPDIEYVVDLRGLLLYLGEKVCKFYMCLWCNLRGRGFLSMEAAQTHMRDKGHCKMLHEGDTLLEYSSYYNYALSYPDHEDDMDVDEEFDVEQLDGSDFQLTLPSGATIGHRSLALYYKQHFNPNRELAVKRPGVTKLMSTYRALGWKGDDKKLVSKNARDMKFLNRIQTKYFLKLGVKANKMQKFFRPQVPF